MYQKFAKIYDRFMEHCDYSQWEAVVEEDIAYGGAPGRRLLDLGCGTGELLLRLKDRYECSGLDLSEEMLKVAKRKLKGMDIPLYLGDMRDFNTGEKYDIMLSLFDTITHLTSIQELEEHFGCVSQSLNEAGLYIFDTVDRGFMDEMFPGGTFVDQRKNMTTIWEHELEEGIDYIDATYFIKQKNGSYEKLEETYEKKLFTHDEIEEAASKANLRIIRVHRDKGAAGEREFFVLRLDGQWKK